MCVKALSYSRVPSDKCRKNGGNRKPSYDTIMLMIYSGRVGQQWMSGGWEGPGWWVEVEKDQDVGIISENLPTKCLPLQKRKVVTWWGRNLDDANMTKHSTSMSPLVGQGDITCCNMKSPASCLWCCFQECMARSDQKEMSNRNRSKVILQNKRPILFKTEGH